MAVPPGSTVRITLDYNKDTGTLHIDSPAPCLDMAINICQQAIRGLEQQLRITTMAQMKQALEEQQKNQEIARMIQGSRA